MDLAVQPQSRNYVIAESTLTRTDALGSQHVTDQGSCPNCDCSFEYAVDDPALVWQSEDRGHDCLYYECPCHLFPIFGERIT